MAGLSRTNDFMLGTATVMLGAEADLFDLGPENSIGLVKNFTLTTDPSYTELSQGVKNTLVHSILTQNTVRASMEAYEYTGQNIAYALGLGGTFDKKVITSTVATPVADNDTSFDVAAGDGADFAVDDYVMIHVDTLDNFVIRKITAIATDELTVNAPFDGVIPAGVKVSLINKIGGGSKEDQPYYSAKIAGKLANGEPVVILIPKVRIVQGFNFAFTSDDYANMPFEFTVYDPVNTDTHYSYFGGESFHIYRA